MQIHHHEPVRVPRLSPQGIANSQSLLADAAASGNGSLVVGTSTVAQASVTDSLQVCARSRARARARARAVTGAGGGSRGGRGGWNIFAGLGFTSNTSY